MSLLSERFGFAGELESRRNMAPDSNCVPTCSSIVAGSFLLKIVPTGYGGNDRQPSFSDN